MCNVATQCSTQAQENCAKIMLQRYKKGNNNRICSNLTRDKYINRLYAYKLFEKNELYVFMRNIHSSFHLTTA